MEELTLEQVNGINFDITVTDGGVMVSDDAMKLLTYAQALDAKIAKETMIVNHVKDIVREEMKKKNLAHFETSVCAPTLSPDTEKEETERVVDFQGLEDQGLYEMFVQEKHSTKKRKGSFRMNFHE